MYSSSDALWEHDFNRQRNQLEVISDSILVPYRIPTHFKNNALVKNLLKNNIFDDLATKRVDCLITVGNFSLSKRIYTALNTVNADLKFSTAKRVLSLDLQHFCSIITFQRETSTTKNISIIFSTDMVDFQTTWQNMFSLQCALDMKDFTELSNICKPLRKTHQTHLSCQRTSHLSIF